MAICATWLATLARAQTPAAPEEDIRAARAIIEIPAPQEPSYFWWYVAVALIVVSAIAIIAWRWLASRRPQVSAMTRALAELRAMEQGRAALDDEAFAAQVADVLRRYVVVVHGIAAPQRTSEEFLQECLERKVLAAPSLEILRGFLRSCDIAKFAGGKLADIDRLNMLEQAKNMVLAPLPQAEKPPTEEAA